MIWHRQWLSSSYKSDLPCACQRTRERLFANFLSSDIQNCPPCCLTEECYRVIPCIRTFFELEDCGHSDHEAELGWPRVELAGWLDCYCSRSDLQGPQQPLPLWEAHRTVRERERSVLRYLYTASPKLVFETQMSRILKSGLLCNTSHH